MQRRLASHLLSESSKAFAETINIVRRSPAQEQRNFAVAVEENVSSDASEIQKRPKRVSKDERRSMVESFVNSYRAMNSGSFPTATLVKKELGGSYYVVKDIVQELQYKSQMPSTGTTNDNAILYQNAGVMLGKPDTVKDADVATKQEDGPRTDMEEKTLFDKIDSMPTMDLKTTKSVEKNKLENEDGRMSALNRRTSLDEFVTRTLGTEVEVEEVELTAHKVDEQTLPLHYLNFSDETEKPSTTVDSSTDTANDRYLLKEEDKDSYSATTISEDNTNDGHLLKEDDRDSYSATTISEDNVREESTSKIDQEQQSSDLATVTRDMPEEHAKKPFKWSLKSLADGLMRMWRRS